MEQPDFSELDLNAFVFAFEANDKHETMTLDELLRKPLELHVEHSPGAVSLGKAEIDLRALLAECPTKLPTWHKDPEHLYDGLHKRFDDVKLHWRLHDPDAGQKGSLSLTVSVLPHALKFSPEMELSEATLGDVV